MSVSRKEKVSFEKFYAFDSTIITLFSEDKEGCRSQSQKKRKEKERIESVHHNRRTADANVFANMSKTNMYDKKFLQYLHAMRLKAACCLVFDNAYSFTVNLPNEVKR